MPTSLFAAIPEPVQVFLREWVLWTLLNGFCVPLALPAILAFLVLLLFFRFGIGLGLPRLFWLPNPGPQFMVGIGIGAVLWQLFLAGYVFEEFATNFTIDRPPFCEIRPPYLLAKGLPDTEFPGRFRYEPASVWSIWRYAAVVVGAALAMTVVVSVIVWLLQSIGRLVRSQIFGWRPFARQTQEPRVNFGIWLPLGSIVGWLAMTGLTAFFLMLPAQYAANPIGAGLIDLGGWGNAAERRAEIDLHITARKKEEGRPQSDQVAMPAPGSSASPRADAREWFHPYTPVYAAFTLNFAVIGVVSLILVALPAKYRFFSPAVGIVLLLNIVVFGAILLMVFPPLNVSGNFILLSLAVVVVLAGRSYKFRFPNMPSNSVPLLLEKRYHELIDAESKITDDASAERAVPEMYATSSGASTIEPVFSHLVPYPCPACWSGPKPPLAIVSLSGGGSRAASWAMQVLVALEEKFLKPGKGRPPMGLPYHTRLIVGASGGMLAGAYYAASLAAPSSNDSVNRNAIPRASGNTSPISSFDLLDGVRQDFLTPITHTLVNHDLLALFSALRFGYDRGQAFEDALRIAMRGQLHVPITSLRDGEAAGWRPSLIFSPMLVEDGRQLFISNLDLLRVTQNRAFILGEDDRRSPTDPYGFGLLSREGVEFFKLFPDATDFTIATAARMSASFPYVLPGVPLRTNPPRRVVDAGYYDNFGIGIAASWLFNHMDWIRENTCGVVVIQIRDGTSEAGRKREEVFDSFPSLIDRGMQWLTTPPDGLWNFRTASNAFRNDNLLHLLNEFFVAQGFPRGFFATVAFEFSGGNDVALNFTLSPDEIQAIEAAIEKDSFKDRAESLLNWWHSRLDAPAKPLTLAEVDK